MEGTVQALFVTAEKKGRPEPQQTVSLNVNGLDGDFHSRSATRRQILLLSANTLDEFDLKPGTLMENLVVEGIDVMKLEPGQRLSAGSSVLEVTVPCEPCIQMERIRSGLKKALEGKRGMFARVITPGTIRVGDRIQI